MQVKMIKSLWGMEGTLEEMLSRIAEAGYAGFEWGIPQTEDQRHEYMRLIRRYHLIYIPFIYTHQDHQSSFETLYRLAMEFEPVLINAQSARDFIPWDEQCRFFEHALALEQKLAIPVAHETHRSRALCTPWQTARLLHEFPDLKITADFSHWCTVCETLLEEQEENLDKAILSTIHIHARVGTPQAPQASHPAAPEHAVALEEHESWWQRICQHRESEGAQVQTVTVEYGPPPYMPTLPFTGEPVADLWDVCYWAKNRFERKYSEWMK